MLKARVKLIIGFFFSGVVISHAQQVNLQKFELPVKISVRAIAVENDSTFWFAGTRGVYGYTEDNGRHWHIDSARINAFIPEFRSIAVTNNHTLYLLNTGSPAYLLKSTDKGKNLETVYTNAGKDIFFDSMKFWDDQDGIAIGDPVNNCFTIITTVDGGETWQPINCSQLPKSLDSEACFASSNTSVAVFKNNIWIATGGSHARVLTSTDKGKTWSAYETPIMQGKQLQGIFSIDFYDEKHGIITGGNYDQKLVNEKTKAITDDGGKKWKLIADGQSPAFGSCVQFQPNSNAKIILVASLPGIYLSNDGGRHWNEVKDASGKTATESYYTFQFSPSGNVAWFAGAEGKIARITFR